MGLVGGFDEDQPAGMPLDKHGWHPSPLPGQIVIVSTVDVDGEPNIAPKSWVSMAAFEGPVVGFGCNVEHSTYRNIATTGEFVVNVPARSLVQTVWSLADTHGGERTARSGLTLVPSSRVAAPRVAECRAFIECRYRSETDFGSDEVFVFGTVVAAAIDRDCVQGSAADRYGRLDPVFFLESGLYAGLTEARRVADAD